MSGRKYPETYLPGVDTEQGLTQDFVDQYRPDTSNFDGVFEVPDSASEKGSPLFRGQMCSLTENNNLVTTLHPLLTTLHEAMQYIFRTHADKLCLGTRKTTLESYTHKTYREDDFVLSMFLPNSYEWFVSDLACIAYSITTTCLFNTITPHQAAHLLNLTRSPVVVLTLDKVLNVLTVVYEYKVSSIRVLIISDCASRGKIPSTFVELARDLKVELRIFKEIVAMGIDNPLDYLPPTPSGMYTLSFTSGTLGNPKGAIMTHAGACAALTSMVGVFLASYYNKTRALTGEYSVLCILPLANIYQRVMCLTELFIGATIYIPTPSQDPKLIVLDLVAVRPCHMAGVPRLFNRIDAAIKQRIKSLGWVASYMCKRALEYKKEKYKDGHIMTQHWLYDSKFTQKIRVSLGFDRMQTLITGSTTLLPHTIRRMRSLLNVDLIQGYGLTESFASVTVPHGVEENPVSCGFISCTTEMMLRDRPDLGFSWAKNRSGEIYLRGPQISQEYYRDPVRTLKAYDADGWFLTGDIGRVASTGRLQVIDRAKSFLKIQDQPHCISPEKVENVHVLFNLGLVTQIYIHGTQDAPFLVAVVVLDEKECLAMLKRSGDPQLANITHMDKSNQRVLNKNTPLRRFLLGKINDRVLASLLLRRHEMVANIHLFYSEASAQKGSNEGFTEANGILTSTFKLKRQRAYQVFEQALAAMFAQGPILRSVPKRSGGTDLMYL